MQITIARNILFLLIVTIITILTFFFISRYCDIFYDFGIDAKNRLEKNSFSTFIITPLFFWISAYLCRAFSPNSSGSSLGKIKIATYQLKKSPQSYEEISHLLNLRIVIISSISSLISAFGGGALGREAPSIHMSTSIFVIIADKLKKTFTKIHLDTWLFIGSGVGFAVAFAAPVAAFIYMSEKLFRIREKNFKSNIIWIFLSISVVAVMLHKTAPIFALRFIDFHWHLDMFLVALLAIICGIMAFFFNKICIFFYEKISAIKTKKWHLVPIIAGLAVATISFYCGVHSFSGGIKTANDALNSAEVILSYKEVIGRIINTILTFIAGCAGGLVAPSVAIGIGIGSVISSFAKEVDIAIFLLSGMSAFLAPILGFPFAAAMVVLETSNQSLQAFPFLLFPSIISFFTAKLLGVITKSNFVEKDVGNF